LLRAVQTLYVFEAPLTCRRSRFLRFGRRNIDTMQRLFAHWPQWRSRMNCVSLFMVALVVTLPAHARRGDPTVLESPEQIAGEVHRLSSQTPFSISTLAFYGNSLFAASNIGLLEIEDHSVRRLYRWNKLSPEIAGAWTDPVHNLLFIHDPQGRVMRAFDGTSWTPVPIPSLPRSFRSRGEVTKVYRAFASDKDFYLVGRGGIWRWASEAHTWKSQLTPPIPDLSAVVDAFHANGKIFSVVRNEPFHTIASRDFFESDSIHYYDAGTWHRIPNPADISFFSMSATSTGKVGYLCSETHHVIRVTEEAITQLDDAPLCEQVIADARRIVVYGRQGFLMWENGPVWLKLGPAPALGPEPEHPLAFAVRGKTVAYAISSIVDLRRSDRKANQFRFTPATRLWISGKGSLQAVTIPGLQTFSGIPQSMRSAPE
jgi:hypothetical protein